MSIPNTLERGIFHILVGLSIAVAILLVPRMTLALSLGVTTILLLSFEFLRLRVPAINKWFFLYFGPLLREGETSHLTGATYVLIAALIAFLAFQRDIAVIALSFLAVGDGVASIVGRHAGKTKVLRKTLEGDLACFVSCLVTGFVASHLGLSACWPTIIVGSASATIAEAMPLPINDNLTMPLFAAIAMTLMEI